MIATICYPTAGYSGTLTVCLGPNSRRGGQQMREGERSLASRRVRIGWNANGQPVPLHEAVIVLNGTVTRVDERCVSYLRFVNTR
eukprot:1260496-Pyramimonas_sp.AAC.1